MRAHQRRTCRGVRSRAACIAGKLPWEGAPADGDGLPDLHLALYNEVLPRPTLLPPGLCISLQTATGLLAMKRQAIAACKQSQPHAAWQ